MSWTTPTTRATGDVITAANWNTDLVNNLKYLHGDAGTVTINDSVISEGGYLVGNPSQASTWIQAGSGTVSVSDGAGHFYEDVTFPAAFGNAVLAVAATAGTGSGGVTVDVNSASTTGFRAISPQNSTAFYWIAVGH